MVSRERAVVPALAAAFIAACTALTFLVPVEPPDPITVVALIALYAVVSRVEFEVGSGHAVPTQLVFIPMLFLAPLPLVPLMVAAAYLLSSIPDWIRGQTHLDRWWYCLADSWFSIGPVAVLGLFAADGLHADGAPIYLAAFGAQVLCELAVTTIREGLGHRLSAVAAVRQASWFLWIDAMLSPVGFIVALAAVGQPVALAALLPLVWLLAVFSHERRERYGAALELNRAYRGTVMLLADVVEAEDGYTADHSRSVVELVNAVADEMQVPATERQELEFAALLHDVGKITIPKEILNKPSRLTDEEFDLIKTHTIEGQLLLDRVGGLLGRVGSIVRSCHERWDGGGYPDGLAGTVIPLPARIVFCCDAYNAMTTDRPYRAAMPSEAALEELRKNTGTQFDPNVVVAVETVVLAGAGQTDQSAADAVRAIFAGRGHTKQLEVA